MSCLLSDYGKEEIIRSMNLIVFNVFNSWYTSPSSPFRIIVMYKLKESTLYLKSGENSTIHFLFTQYDTPTPYNVGSVQRRLFSTVGDSISTAEE